MSSAQADLTSLVEMLPPRIPRMCGYRLPGDLCGRGAARAGEVLYVEPKAFRVLLFLLRNPHKLIKKDELLDAVWNDCAVSENSLTRSIALLRGLLGDDTREPRYILTVPTVGYRFLCEVNVRDDASASGRQPRSRRRKAEMDLSGPAESMAPPEPKPIHRRRQIVVRQDCFRIAHHSGPSPSMLHPFVCEQDRQPARSR